MSAAGGSLAIPESPSVSWYRWVRPLLFRLEPERAHALVTGAARLAPALLRLAPAWPRRSPASLQNLRVRLWGLEFANPVGLAAGFDKDGELVQALAPLGFGFLETGTVTPRPQPGNPRPRLFRLEADQAIINRMGFNNRGAAALAERLAARPRPIPVGVNMGKNRDTPVERAVEDYLLVLRAVHAVADYVVVNVSSPNTPGLRSLQQRRQLTDLLGPVRAERDRLTAGGRVLPLLVKVAPDLEPGELEEVAGVALDQHVDGLVATNTTLRREGLSSSYRQEAGGLSGKPLRSLALATVAALYRLTSGRLPIIGVGGIQGAQDAYDFIRAGATLVQVYTGLIYKGPGLVAGINRGLAARLERDGFASVQQAVGTSQAKSA